MELAIFNNPIPIKAIPEQNLNTLLMGQFLDWLSAILSLNEEATTKLEYALPAIKEHCWSMGFPEIKKMIEMYADSKLSVKPIPNHFDRIKFGEVVNAYKQQKPIKKTKINEPEMTEEDKELLIFAGVVNCFDEFIHNGKIIDGYVWVYDHLVDVKVLENTPKEKRDVMPLAKARLTEEQRDSLSYNDYANFLKELENKRKDQSIINTAKKILLERYFNILKTNKKHIKNEKI
jgi:hypothetical protein